MVRHRLPLTLLALAGLLAAAGRAAADVTVVVTSGNVSAQAAGVLDGAGVSDAKNRSLGPADFPGGSGPRAEVGVSVFEGEPFDASGGSANSLARVSSGAAGDGTFTMGADLSGNASASCTSPVARPGASASAATSGVLTIELQLDEPMDLQVTGELRVVATRALQPPTPPPSPAATASFSVGGVARSVSAGDSVVDEAQVDETVRLPAGVTVLQLQQSVSGASLSACDQLKSGSTDIDLALTLRPAQDAGEVAWINPAGGAWGVEDNWDPARVPAAADRARFELASTFAVQLGGARTLAGLVARASLFDLTGGTLGLTGANRSPALDLGGGARLTLLDATMSLPDATLGTVAGAGPSTLRVAAAGALDAGTLRVGGAAPGVLEVVAGSVNAATTEVGGSEGVPELAGQPLRRGLPAAGVTAATTPDQAGGKLRIAGGQAALGNLRVGADGSGLVDVRGGGLLRATGDARVGVAPGPGFAVVDGVAGGAFSTWESTGALVVGDSAEATFDVLAGGRASAQSVVIGAEPTGVGALTVAEFDTGGTEQSRLTTPGRLTVGDRGAATLTVTKGDVRAAELIAGLNAEGDGTIRLTGRFGRILADDILAVGVRGAGRLDVGEGSVSANQLAVAFITPAGVPTGPGAVEARDGAFLFVTTSATIGKIDLDTGATGAPGVVRVQSGSVLDVRSPGGSGFVDIQNGDLIVEGADDVAPSRLRAGTVDMTRGTLRIAGGARAEVGELTAIGTLGVPPVVEVAGGPVPPVAAANPDLQVTGTLQVGDAAEAGLPGILRLADGGRVSVGQRLVVGPGGSITGTGRIRVGALDVDPAGGTLTNLGTVSAGASPGTIAVDGGYAQGPGGRLVVEAAGTQPGQFDVLQVGGAAALDGTLVLRFIDGYLPQPGDTLPFLAGNTTGAFKAVRVDGVAPGFDFTLAPAGGALVLTAKNAAQPAPCRDAADGDGDGVTCTDVCPGVADADQADRDGDLIGDACDTCTGGLPLVNPVLTIAKGKLALRGTLAQADAQLDPAATGVRILIEDGAGRTLATLDAPPGAFDRSSKRGWKARRFTSRKGALRTLSLENATVGVKGVVRGVNPKKIAQPVSARILLDTTGRPTSRCAEVVFAGPAGVNPACTARRGRLLCRAVKPRGARAR